MNAVLTIVFAMLIVLVLVAAWSTFIGGTCTKDSQCPAGYACSGGSAGGKCVAAPKGRSFTVDPKIHATGPAARHPPHSAMDPDACSVGRSCRDPLGETPGEDQLGAARRNAGVRVGRGALVAPRGAEHARGG